MESKNYKVDDRNFNTYIEMQKEISKREFSLYEQVDKHLFTLSSAGLGFSIVIIRSVIDISIASYTKLWFASWFAFMIAIVINLISYSPGKKALKYQRTRIQKYYLRNDVSVLKEKNTYSIVVDILRGFSVAFYIAALILTVLFIMFNQDNFIKPI